MVNDDDDCEKKYDIGTLLVFFFCIVTSTLSLPHSVSVLIDMLRKFHFKQICASPLQHHHSFMEIIAYVYPSTSPHSIVLLSRSILEVMLF